MTTPTTSSPITYTVLSSGTPTNLLLSGTQWASPNIAYSFVVPGASYFATNYPDPTFLTNTAAFSLTQQNATSNALAAWGNIANLNFTQVADNASVVGDIRLGFSYSYSWGTSAGGAYTPDGTPSGGDVWLDPLASDGTNGVSSGTFSHSAFQGGTYAYYGLLHELGHALGLKHPFDTTSYNTDVVSPAGTGWDSRVSTLMSYTSLSNHADAIGFSFNPTTPMLLDVAAIQAMYGANMAYNAGDTVYAFNDNPGQYYFQTLWDGGGNNTISYSGNTNSSIDLRQGNGSTIGNSVYAYTATNSTAYKVSNLWIAWGTHIDTAITTGFGNNTLTANNDGDLLIGGAGNDLLIGGTGNDVFAGGGGSDIFTGGGGTDTFNVNTGTDAITDLGVGGADVVKVASGAIATATLAAAWTATAATSNAGNASVDAEGFNLDLHAATGLGGWTLTNSGAGATMTGSANNDTLTGGSGADTFNVVSGTDTITNLGVGADVLVVSHGATATATLAAIWTATAATSNAGTASIDTKGFNLDLHAATGSGGWMLTNSGSGNDTLIGSGSIDTLKYSHAEAAYTLTQTASGFTVTSAGGTDTLTGIDRLQFSDVKLALDLNGNAGITAKILGAVFGVPSVGDTTLVGTGLGYLDGGMSESDLSLLALQDKLGIGFSNSQEVNLLYQNLTNAAPNAATIAQYVGEITSGQYTQASLAVMAEEMTLNANNIKLAGLAQTGIVYS